MGKDNKSRIVHNNYNPKNTLELNKYHQLGAKTHASQSKKLHKKKRDLERLIKHKQMKNQEIDQNKIQQLQQMSTKLNKGHKKFEKNMRKQFFIKSQYRQIMEIQMRKIKKKLKELESQQLTAEVKEELKDYQKKKRYIQYYPKNLKYVSLFPNAKPLDEGAIEFQNKIMSDIEQRNRKIVEKKNVYVSQNVKSEHKHKSIKKKKVDNFFIMEDDQNMDQE